MTDQNNVLAAALAYAARGVPVFPCNPVPKPNPKSKAPFVHADKDADGNDIPGTGWPKKASTDPKTITSWWRRNPDALLALAPGWAGAFVVDLDPKGEDVAAVEARLVEAIGEPLPDNVARSRTQSGGLHLWFAHPDEEWGNTTPGLHNIDIRCDSGYVIVAPSQMLNGNRYEWITAPFDPSTAPPVPERLLDLIRARRDKTVVALADYRPSRPVVPVGVAEAARRKYARAALDGLAAEVAGAQQGHRGATLYAAAARAGRFVACGALSEREAMASLEDGADGCGLIQADGRDRVLREIARGFDKGRADSADMAAKLDEIGREATERAERYSTRGGPVARLKPVVAPEAPLPDDYPETADSPEPLDGEVGGDTEPSPEILMACAALWPAPIKWSILNVSACSVFALEPVWPAKLVRVAQPAT